MTHGISDARTRANLVGDVLKSHAPNDEARAVVRYMIEQMRNESESPEYQELTLASALVDGLRYGNWPWKINPPRDAQVAGHV